MTTLSTSADGRNAGRVRHGDPRHVHSMLAKLPHPSRPLVPSLPQHGQRCVTDLDHSCPLQHEIDSGVEGHAQDGTVRSGDHDGLRFRTNGADDILHSRYQARPVDAFAHHCPLKSKGRLPGRPFANSPRPTKPAFPVEQHLTGISAWSFARTAKFFVTTAQ